MAADILDWMPAGMHVRDGFVIFGDNADNPMSNRYLAILDVLPIPYESMSQTDQRDKLSKWMTFANRMKAETWGITVYATPSNIEDQVKAAEAAAAVEPVEKVREGLKEYIAWLRDKANKDTKDPRFLLWMEYEPEKGIDPPDTEPALLGRFQMQVEDTIRNLMTVGLEVRRHAKGETNFVMELLYTMFNPFSSRRITLQERTQALYRASGAAQRSARPQLDNRLYYAPTNAAPISGNSPYMYLDGGYHSSFYVNSLTEDSQFPLGWLDIYKTLGTHVSYTICFEKQDKQAVLANIPANQKFIQWIAGKQDDTGTAGTSAADANEKIQTLSNFASMLSAQSEEYFQAHIYFTVHAETVDELKVLCGRLRTEYTNQLDIRPMFGKRGQSDGYLATMPLGYMPYRSQSKLAFLTSSMPLAFLFTGSTAQDEKGIPIGVDDNGAFVFLNPFFSEAHINAHAAIMAPSGAGKTFLMQAFMRKARLYGHKVRLILPIKAREDYANTVDDLGGKLINFYPRSKDVFNPHDIHTDSKMDNSGSLLDAKLKYLRTLYTLLIPGIKEEELDILYSLYADLYGAFGITSDDESVARFEASGNPYPTFTDLVEYAEKRGLLPNLRMRLFKVLQGLATNINGQTNVHLDNKFLAFNVDEKECGDLLPIYYYIAMEICEEDVKRDRRDLSYLVMDEVQEFLRNSAPGVAKHVADLYATLRSFGVSVWCATQKSESFSYLLENGKEEFFTTNAGIVIVLKQSQPAEVNNIKKIYGLSEQEGTRLLNMERGQGIILYGSKLRTPFTCVATPKEHVLFENDPTKI